MRPVANHFPVSQEFGSDATAGVVADSDPKTGTGYLVYLYGNYQPFGHAGQDIACPIGTPVHAIADGTVIWADWGTNLPGDDSDWGYRQRWYMYKNFPGIVTLIQHDGWISMYGHLSNNDAAPVGTVVKEGQLIGLSGNTKAPGVTLGAHLHVGALVDLTYSCGNGTIYGCVDPTPYYGAIAPQSITQEDDMFTDSDRAALARIDQKADLLPTGNYWADMINAMARVDQRTFDNIAAVTAIPVNVLNQQFTLPDGKATNLAGILAAINARPVTTVTGTSIDVDALVARLKAELPAAVLTELTSKLSK